MLDVIEQDALASTPDAPAAPLALHAHEALKSFVATPRMDLSLTQKMLSWWKSELTPGLHIARKDADGPRYMFLITSNSYMDREKETIATEALKDYEDSCYPGEDLYHNDNPLLWWHDDDVVMGEIVAVNVSGPFLVEVAKEAPTRVARVLWDYAEQNGDEAGVSHRFGYREKDRDPDGTYRSIVKKETTYLPERELAANIGTYAGVMGMASPQSDARLDEIFEKVAGIKGAAAKLHAKSGELEKDLAAAGIQHKAAKPPVPPLEADTADGAPPASPDEDAKAARPPEMGAQMQVMNQIYALVMDLVDSQAGLMEGAAAMAKSFKEAEDARTAERTAEKTYTASLEEQIKALGQSVTILEKRLNLAPRSVQTQAGETAEAVKAAVDQAQAARDADNFQEVPGWGKLMPPPNYD